MKKISLFTLFLFIIVNFSCERDDICPESTPTTPSLIIDVFDIDNAGLDFRICLTNLWNHIRHPSEQ